MKYKGARWHRPRGPGLVGPELLAEDAGCLPTSSWWAIETPLTLARRGSGMRPSGWHGGCCGRSGRRSCTATTTTGVLVNASWSDGTEFQKRMRSYEELSGPGAARKHGPRGWRRQIAYTAEECTGYCRRRHRSLRGHQPYKFRRRAGRQAAS